MRDASSRDATGGPLGTASVRLVADQAVVELSGEHDMATIGVVNDAFAAAEAASSRLVVVDLSACSFIDSTIVRALLLARERATGTGRRVVLVHTTPPIIASVLQVSGVADVFESFESIDQALAPGGPRPSS